MAGTPNVSGAPGQFRAASVPDGHHASEVRGRRRCRWVIGPPQHTRLASRTWPRLTHPAAPFGGISRARVYAVLVAGQGAAGPLTIQYRTANGGWPTLRSPGSWRYRAVPAGSASPARRSAPARPARLSATWVDRRRGHSDTDPGRRGHAGQTAGPRAGQILSVTSMRSSQVSVRPRIWTSRSSHSGNGCWARYTTRTGADRVHAHVVGPSDPPTGRDPATLVSRARAS